MKPNFDARTTIFGLQEFRPILQTAFEIGKASAELDYAKRAEHFPNNPQLATPSFHVPVLIHRVFFEYCAQAHKARVIGNWTATDVRRAVDAAFPIICDFYSERELGCSSDQAKATYRAVIWPTVQDDPRWRDHLSALAKPDDREPDNEGFQEIQILDLDRDAMERIGRAGEDARAHLKQSSVTPEEKRAATLHFFDAIAWEYLVSTISVADFESHLADVVRHVESRFGKDEATFQDRTDYWIAEARERATNGIIGDRILIKFASDRAPVLRELGERFRRLPGSEPDIQAMFLDGGQKEIRPGPRRADRMDELQRRFEQCAREAVAVLGCRFSSSRGAVGYWLDLLKQESPFFRRSIVSRVCFASAELCTELATRALEADITAPAMGSKIDAKRPTIEAPAWESIEIRFLSDERVQIVIGKDTETRNYAEFGCEDRRSKKPNLSWATLRRLAEGQGTISPRNALECAEVEKRIQEIRKTLRNRFGLKGDPLPYIDGTGYRACFKIHCAPSYHS